MANVAGRSSALVAAAGIALVAAGCGSATSAPASPQKIVLDAYTSTVGARSADVAINERITGVAGETQPVTLSGTGSVDFGTRQEQLSLSVPSVGTMVVRSVYPVMYIQMPAALASQLPSGKSWLSINLDEVAQSKLGASLSQLSDSSQAATQTLSYLQSVSSSGITTVGHATVRGVQTTEYKASVDLTKAAASKSAQAQAATQKLESELGTSSLPVQVWIDAKGMARRIGYQINVPNAGDGGAASVDVTLDLYNFGVPVSVSAPPAAQVDDITSQAIAASPTTPTTTGG
jgi:hypothetical protein